MTEAPTATRTPTQTRSYRDGRLVAQGFPLAEVTGVEATGDFWLPKVAGPPHLSLADRGITFATNRQRGTCIQLRHPQPGPYPVLKHPAVTVTVEDPEALEAILRRA